MAKILTELKKFSETTSVAGVSRIVKTKETILKVIWTIILVLCTGLLVYFLVTLFIEYYKWPTTTEFGEDLKNDIVFPDVTICSLNRILNDANARIFLNRYFKMINMLLIISGEERNKISSMLYSLPSFVRNLPKLNVMDDDCPKFIADCKLYGNDWQMTQTCTDNFTEVWNADYYSCFTIRTSQLNISEGTTMRGMTLVLNNGPPSDEQIPYDFSLDSSLGNGVKLTIHSPGTPPDLKRGITLAPGTETGINIVQTNVERLDKPYNPLGCSRQKFMPSSSEAYARDQCIDYCVQSKIFEECGCVAHWLAIPELLKNISVCGNMSEASEEDAIRELTALECARNISKNSKECMKYCLIPCSEKSYSSFVSSTSWPQNSIQLAIYERYFQNCIRDFPKVRERFADFEHLVNIRYNESLAIAAEQNISNNNYSSNDLKEIEKSLLVVKLVFEDDLPFIHVDKPLYTWDVMVGVVGGLLSLWLGMSAVVIAEVFELIYFLIKSCFK